MIRQTPLRDDTHRGSLIEDARVQLRAEPGRVGHIHLIDWHAQRASVRWNSGVLSGVGLADIEAAANPVEAPRASHVAQSEPLGASLYPAE